MSWSVSGTVAKSRLNVDLGEPSFADDEEVRPAQDEQYYRAMRAAEHLIEAVGRPDQKVAVTLSGHANPNHGEREGYSLEYVTVSVSILGDGSRSEPKPESKQSTIRTEGPAKTTTKKK